VVQRLKGSFLGICQWDGALARASTASGKTPRQGGQATAEGKRSRGTSVTVAVVPLTARSQAQAAPGARAGRGVRGTSENLPAANAARRDECCPGQSRALPPSPAASDC
jgi:hypothetical protein